MTIRIQEVWLLTSELESERASSFRQERWCNIFLENGARLRIFNLRGAFSYSDVYCNSPAELAEFRRLGVARYRGPRASVREGIAARALRRAKHFSLVDLYVPNVIRLLWHVNRLLAEKTEPVVLMASSPPFSLAVIGGLLKRIHGSKLVFAVDMRDAWALHKSLGGFKPLRRLIERRSLRKADHISTVSYGLASEFAQAYGIHVKVMYNVATHYFDLPEVAAAQWSRMSPKVQPHKRKLVYTGSAPEGHYDIKSIVSAVVRLRQLRPDLADKLQLVFVGACDEVHREATRQTAESGDIVFIGHVSHVLSRSVQMAADALLFLGYFGEKNAGVVSTKLFEYLCLGKPVLPLGVYRNSDVDRLLRRYCSNGVNVHTTEEIMAALSKVAEDGNDWLPRLKNIDSVRELLNDYQNHAKNLLA